MEVTKEIRNCAEVIDKMLKIIPVGHVDLIEDLKLNQDDASYKAPEQTIQWKRTMETLMKHIPAPANKWEFEILSVFTTRSIAELKELHGKHNVDIKEED